MYLFRSIAPQTPNSGLIIVQPEIQMNDKPKTAAERKKEERQRKRAAGLVPKEIWCYPEHWKKIESYIERLKKVDKQLDE